VLYVATQITAVLSIVFEPFLPTTCKKLRDMLNIQGSPQWLMADQAMIVPPGTQLGKADLLFAKVEDEQVELQRAKLKASVKIQEEEKQMIVKESTHNPQKEDISFDQFLGMDLRVGTILEAERVPKADRLLKFLVDTGLDQRTIVSGVAEHFSPEQMIGKQVTVLMNLPPRKIKGVVSQGMLLMAEDADGALRIMTPENGTDSGAVIG
ncbi:MAG: methionine--tRNA ligase subunit beta, partial [Schleiferiaceae bacterium]|nr:methionine--tRNA ligase subunit beta [Schleiferiaceae bacterium]